jgi:uncharacterized protein with PIN domain
MDTSWFRVHLEARAPAGVAQIVDEGAADKLMDLLVEQHGTVSSDAGRWEVTISLEEPEPARAAAVAAALVESLAAVAGLPDWPMVRVEAVRQDVLEEDNSGEAGAG